MKIPYHSRGLVAKTVADVIREMGHIVLIVLVSAKHAHVLAELPVDPKEFNRIVGWCKNRSSRMLTEVLPGKVWARGDNHKLVRNRAHRKNVYKYLRDDQGTGAVAWMVKIIFDDD